MHEPCLEKIGRPKSNPVTLRLTSRIKDIKTLSETVFRSLIGSIFSEEIEFQNLSSRHLSDLHEPTFLEPRETKIKSDDSETYLTH